MWPFTCRNKSVSVTLILLVNDSNSHLVTKSLLSLSSCTWLNRELVIVNSSNLRFTHCLEIRCSKRTSADAMRGAAIGASSGDVCIVLKVGCDYPPNIVELILPCLKHSIAVDFVTDGHKTAYAFFRLTHPDAVTSRVKISDQPCAKQETVQLDFDPSLTEHDTEKLNICCPAGIGDVLWILAKLGRISNAVFWLPEGEQKRAGALCRLAGVRYGYMPGLTTDWVWSKPGSPDLPEKGWVVVQANRHLEAGKKLTDWYKHYPLQYPLLRLNYQSPRCRYVVGFACASNYMGGQLDPKLWAALYTFIERNYAPVIMIGAGSDVDFCREIEAHFKPKLSPMYDQPLEEAMSVLFGAVSTVGVASGLMISAIAYGVPTIVGYPAHLTKMPGSWEPPTSKWSWCLTQDLHDSVVNKDIFKKLCPSE